jgi:CBS domain containing-hemolysin-like protein
LYVAPTDTLRQVAESMAESRLTSYPVIESSGHFVGIITINDLLTGRSRERLRESDRQRVLRLRWPFSRAAAPVQAETTVPSPKEKSQEPRHAVEATEPAASPAAQAEMQQAETLAAQGDPETAPTESEAHEHAADRLVSILGALDGGADKE